jgi:D-alanyl-D-alanine carboxypeptidase/D-alanyl-D-alanine-endopeptidase (penicillin-binding protein 4)
LANRAAAAVVLTGAAVLVTAGRPPAASASAAGSGITATPVLSIRRLPGWVAQTVAAQRLDQNLDAILDQSVVGSAAHTSCLVVTQGGRSLFSSNANQELIPASSMKLLTSTALIERLGASRRLVTQVVTAKPVGGVVKGNLYLVGDGDPLLYTTGYAAALGTTLFTSLNQLADQVLNAGVTRITGAVVGDESKFDQLRAVPTWSATYQSEGDVGPLSALEVNDGASPGAPPSTAGLSASALAADNSSDPAVSAAVIFTELLQSDGITVSGVPASGSPPAGTSVLTSISSATLGQEVDAMLTVSDDTAAELFTKQLGYVESGHGTTAAGVAAVRADLAADELPVSQLINLDGSGLDRGDRVTCNLLQDDLSHLGPSSVVAQGLPIAGQTGTLAGRMNGTVAAGRVRAKTGTLDNVDSLSGFVTPAKGAVKVAGTELGQPLVFANLLNGISSEDLGRQIGDQIGVALATYPQLPTLSSVEPLP